MQISVCGAGWLGLPTAKHLISRGHRLVASKRTDEGVAKLEAQEIQGVRFELGQPLKQAALQPLFSSDVLVLNVPPGRKNFTPALFISRMTELIEHAFHCGTGQLLFISTTAVYGEQSRTVFEHSTVSPETESAKAHCQIEQLGRRVFSDNFTLLRLGGLIDKDRHPVKFLAGKMNLDNGHRRVNLVHKEDVITAITQIIEKGLFGNTYHLCASDHPDRASYYTAAADAKALPAPQFLRPDQEAASPGKIINSDHTLAELGFELAYPSPYNMF